MARWPGDHAPGSGGAGTTRRGEPLTRRNQDPEPSARGPDGLVHTARSAD